MENTSTNPEHSRKDSLSTRKRSKGVMIFGTLFLLFAVEKAYVFTKILIGEHLFLIASLLFLISGLLTLALKWRHTILIINTINFLVTLPATMFFGLALVFGVLHLLGIPVEDRPSLDEWWWIIVEFFTPIVLVVSFYFLTRPKVKALFSPERGEAESKGAI